MSQEKSLFRPPTPTTTKKKTAETAKAATEGTTQRAATEAVNRGTAEATRAAGEVAPFSSSSISAETGAVRTTIPARAAAAWVSPVASGPIALPQLDIYMPVEDISSSLSSSLKGERRENHKEGENSWSK